MKPPFVQSSSDRRNRQSAVDERLASPTTPGDGCPRQPEPSISRGILDVFSTGEAPVLTSDQIDTESVSDLVRDDEIIILLLRPSPLFIVLVPLGSIMALLIITLGLALLAAKVSWIGWSEQQAYGLGFTLIALRLTWQALEWFNRVYILTDRRIVTRAGVLRVSVFETQLKCIQHTSMFMRLRERVFALGTIGFATAGSDMLDSFWVMLRQPVAVHRIIVEAVQRYGNHHRQ